MIDFLILISGGLPKDGFVHLPKQIQAKHGFEGCLASLDLNGESPNILEDAVVPSSLVTAGCDGNSVFQVLKIDNTFFKIFLDSILPLV